MQLFSKKINFPPFPPLFLAKISTLGVKDGLFTQGIWTRQNMDQADDADTLLHHAYHTPYYI